MDWARAERRRDLHSIEGRIFQPLIRLIEIRKSHPVFAGAKTQIIETGNDHVFGYIHWRQSQGLLVLANFSEQEQMVELARFRTYGLKAPVYDLVQEKEINLGRVYTLRAYEFLWLMPK
jgi:amylosucrase/maltose alpha-D-glucosyltransferase/alpha-amylase